MGNPSATTCVPSFFTVESCMLYGLMFPSFPDLKDFFFVMAWQTLLTTSSTHILIPHFYDLASHIRIRQALASDLVYLKFWWFPAAFL